MALIRYQPWSLLGDLHHDLEKLMKGDLAHDLSDVATSDWTPHIDIKEEKDHFTISADVPGVNPKDINVTMENGVLTIQGERESEKKKEEKNYTRIERAWGKFYRRFSLPETADGENIKAKTKNGVLELIVPKSRKSISRKIEIKAED